MRGLQVGPRVASKWDLPPDQSLALSPSLNLILLLLIVIVITFISYLSPSLNLICSSSSS